MKKQQSSVFFVLLIVIIVAVGVGIYAYENSQTQTVVTVDTTAGGGVNIPITTTGGTTGRNGATTVNTATTPPPPSPYGAEQQYSSSTTTTGGLTTYNNADYGFIISYPAGVTPFVPSQWSLVPSQDSGAPIVAIPLQNLPQGASYDNATRISIGMSTSSDAITNCLTLPSGNYQSQGDVTVNGNVFFHFSGYGTDSYRLLQGGCWAVDLFSNGAATGGVQNAQADAQLETIFHTLRFY